MSGLFKIDKIGIGSPEIAFVACVHGDELIGIRIFDQLRTISSQLTKPIALVTANIPALNAGKRFIEQDLNRVFPGLAIGATEQLIAHELMGQLKKYKIIIDIHGTNSNIDSLAIVTDLGYKKLKILSQIPINKVAFAPKNIFGGNELISHLDLGISLEYGPDKSGDSWPLAWAHIKQLLVNLEYIAGEKTLYKNKLLYKIYNKYEVPGDFTQEDSINDFKFIEKNEVIGTVDGRKILSTDNFYPLFVGKGRYSNIFALMSTREDIEI